MTTIGVDLGGTKILVGVVEHGRVVATHKASTPTTGPSDVAAAIAELIGRFDGTPHHIGVGTPGQVDDDGVVVGAPNLVGWQQPGRAAAPAPGGDRGRATSRSTTT